MTPPDEGSHQFSWQLRDGRGVAFGDVLRKEFLVSALSTATSVPDVTFWASVLETEAGGEVAFSWNAAQSKAAYFYPSNQAWQEHPVPLKGSRFEYPQRTTIYYLRVVKADESIDVHKIEIEVVPPGPPRILHFVLDPSDFILAGQCVKIKWEATYHARSVDLYRDDTLLVSGAPKFGGTQDCLSTQGKVTYTLIVYGPGGEACERRQLLIK
jgi:hypothetical protein